MIDPNKSVALERAAVFLVVATVALIAFALALPYAAKYLGIEITETAQASVNQTVSVLQTVFVMLSSFFWGATINRTKAEDTTNKALTLATNALNPTAPPDKTVTVAPGETAAVTAAADATNPSAT